MIPCTTGNAALPNPPPLEWDDAMQGSFEFMHHGHSSQSCIAVTRMKWCNAGEGQGRAGTDLDEQQQ